MKARYEIYQDVAKEWRWRFKAKNGRIVADSAEGYKNRDDCYHAIDLIRQCVDGELITLDIV